MKKTKWGQTILELSDVANLPLVSKNAEIVEKKVEELIANIQSGQVESQDEITKEINKIKELVEKLQEDKLDKEMLDEKNGKKYTIVFKNGEIYKREVI